ncbi:AI-2E family transporter [Ciceribacter sp. L1K22]|uniref:AI-2E family transporter n=1 Tax=Ciceribacter sp. L1K22 TaxID=2820275 RepID=UPI001ABDD9D6|nr:AI-2E family transporter [Ciceribacter sp. L1K22]MBO3762551.1 AI-2E family transporter [Ciceribacter sp. L1K22]
MTSEPAPATETPAPQGTSRLQKYIGFILLLLIVYGLYLGREFLTPIVLSFLISLTLTPIVRFLGTYAIPPALSATVLVISITASITVMGYLVSGPVSELLADAPRITERLKVKIHTLQATVEQAVQATQEIDKATEAISERGVQKVVVAQPGILSIAAGTALSIVTTLAITFVLSLFLLASGPLFYEKIVQSVPRLSDKKRVLRAAYTVEQVVSRYLFTITLINIGLGVVVGLGLWLIGIPNAFVWGVAAALLNYLPYVGALINIVLVAMISFATYDSLLFGLAGPAFVLCCNVIEGQFVTPLLLGRRLELNTVAVFISISFWSWIWGFIGALLAVPILVVIKVICDHFDSLAAFGNFLAAQQPAPSAEERQEARGTP